MQNKPQTDVERLEACKKEMEKLQIEFEKLEYEKDYVSDRSEITTEVEPKVASYTPFRRHLEKGKDYFYCTCGQSKLQPFCDGSHKGTGFQPLKFTVHINAKWSLMCGCKHNDKRNGPWCDGSHINVDW